MSSRSLSVIVDSDGQIAIEAHGHQGGSCVQALAPLKTALIGTKPERAVDKPEFRQTGAIVRVRESE